MLEIIKKEVYCDGIVTNAYIVMDRKTKKIMLIDPASEIEKIIDLVHDLGGDVIYIALTHLHDDHIKMVSKIKLILGGLVIMHEEDSKNVNNQAINLGYDIEHIDVDRNLKDNDIIKLGESSFKVIHTPGHTKGSVSFLCDKYLFSGDTLFQGTYGRYDLPTGNREEIMLSIQKLLQLPDEVVVYPGHEGITTIGEERKYY